MNNIIDQPWLYEMQSLLGYLSAGGGEGRFVGGCVRDALLNNVLYDIDIATNLPPDKVIKILNHCNISCIPTGLKHGTITALWKKRSIEITTLRKDIICNGRHAVIAFTNVWEEDAKRRDFTFNALYCDINGKIYDYFTGIEDLKKKKLQFVGAPEARIQEDYLRILRAFRFHTYLCEGLLSPEILEACQKFASCLNKLSGERIKYEMFKLLSYDKALDTILIMQEYNILHNIFPAPIIFSAGLNNYNLTIVKDPIIKLAFLIRKVSLDNTSRLLTYLFNRWKLSRREQKKLVNLVSTSITFNESNLASLVFNLGSEEVSDFLKLSLLEGNLQLESFNHYTEYTTKLVFPSFPLTGNDLLTLGYKGIEIGKMLTKAKKYWEENSYSSSKEELIKYILLN